MKITFDDLQDMARTVWAESRGEPFDGQLAVAHVILNRARDRRWPDRISKVCRQPWQFSCWNQNDPNRNKMLAADPTRQSMRDATAACLDAIDGRDITDGANHYFATYIKAPYWVKDMTHTRTIGRHAFYKG